MYPSRFLNGYLMCQIFPWIFNVADTLLCAGVGLMVVYSLFASHKPHRADEPADLKPVES